MERREVSYPRKEDDSLYVVFDERIVKNQQKSEEAGREMWDPVDWVEIHIPGGKSVVSRPASDSDRSRFQMQYDIYKRALAGEEVGVSGTPLEEMPSLDRGLVMSYKAVKIFTVEQLAALNDGQIAKLGMGAREHVVKAQAYLEVAEDNATATKYAVENDRLKGQIDNLQAQITAMQTQLLESSDTKATPVEMSEEEVEELLS